VAPVTRTESTRPDVEDSQLVPAIVVDETRGTLAELEALIERARAYARGSKAANTLRAYESDLRHFGAWCERRALEAFPAAPETVALYLVDHAERLAVSTLRRRLAAISEAHQAARFPNPTLDPAVCTTWAGIRRTHGKAPDAKEAAVTEVVAAMVAPLGERLIDVRDRTILLIGFAGALRRSELSALDVGDVVETGEGLKVTVARSKTDQEGEGHTVGITYGSNMQTCPIRAWHAWLAAAEIERWPRVSAPPARPNHARPHRRRRDRPHGQAPRERRRLCARAVQRALVALGVRNHRGARRRGRASDHAPRTVDDESGDAGIYPAGRAVRRQPLGEARALNDGSST
jgi:integrase